jgi:hypothetical protein
MAALAAVAPSLYQPKSGPAWKSAKKKVLAPACRPRIDARNQFSAAIYQCLDDLWRRVTIQEERNTGGGMRTATSQTTSLAAAISRAAVVGCSGSARRHPP